MELRSYTKIDGALRTKCFKEIPRDAIGNTEADKIVKIANATVTVSSGKVFYVDPESRGDISEAIGVAGDTGQTEVMWKLAEEFEGERWVLCTLDDMKEARRMGLEYKGSVVAQ